MAVWQFAPLRPAAGPPNVGQPIDSKAASKRLEDLARLSHLSHFGPISDPQPSPWQGRFSVERVAGALFAAQPDPHLLDQNLLNFPRG